MLKIRRPLGRLIFNKGSAILVRPSFLLRRPPGLSELIAEASFIFHPFHSYLPEPCDTGQLSAVPTEQIDKAFVCRGDFEPCMQQPEEKTSTCRHTKYISIDQKSYFKHINSLWPSDTIRCHKTWLPNLLMAPSHYLNQCWLIISEVLWHSPKMISREMFKRQELKITKLPAFVKLCQHASFN